jgi:hypothetical protein
VTRDVAAPNSRYNCKQRHCRWCDCSCDVHLCSLLCCSVRGASALVTFICVLCTLRTQIALSNATLHTTAIIITIIISRSICNFSHTLQNKAVLRPCKCRDRRRRRAGSASISRRRTTLAGACVRVCVFVCSCICACLCVRVCIETVAPPCGWRKHISS